LYALRAKDASVLFSLFGSELIGLDNTLTYIGKGERTIQERILEECFGEGNGTLFRGIGAVLGFRPPRGSLIGKKRPKNYRFSENDRLEIIEWIYANLIINCIELPGNIAKVEENLIREYCPIFNYIHNPRKSKILIAARKSCRDFGLQP
jgi:hypothetical protein